MKLHQLYEAKQAEANELALKLQNIGVDASTISTGDVISIVTTHDKLEQIKMLAKRNKWQIHNSGGTKKLYVDLSPNKNREYHKEINQLYHITDRSLLPSIVKNGLQLQSSTPGMTYPKRVYLYPNIEMAKSRYDMSNQLKLFANKKGFDPVLLQIDNSKGRYKAFLDPENNMGMGGNADDLDNVPVYTSKVVSPNDITIVS